MKLRMRFSYTIQAFCWISASILFSCKDTYTGPYPAEPTCIEYPAIDTVELLNGTVRKEDTTFYISNYVNAFTFIKYYPCNLNKTFRVDGFPIQYSGIVRKPQGQAKDYIELSLSQAILNESIITNYIGLIRNRDSATVLSNEKTSSIDSYKIENDKLKVLLSYSGCTQGRKHTLAIYKTTQKAGITTSYAYIISNPEACLAAFSLWYEFDVSGFKNGTLIVHDALKKHTYLIP